MARRPKVRKENDHALLDLDPYDARLLVTVLAHVGGYGKPVQRCQALCRHLKKSGFEPFRYGLEIEVGRPMGDRRTAFVLALSETSEQRKRKQWDGEPEIEPIANKVPLNQRFKIVRKIDLED